MSAIIQRSPRRSRLDRAKLRFRFHHHPNNDLTGKHPYMLSETRTWGDARDQIEGFRQQLSKRGLPVTKVDNFTFITWRYRNKPRSTQDPSMLSWVQGGNDPSTLNQATIDAYGWKDPYDGSSLHYLFGRVYVTWRKLINERVKSVIPETYFDNHSPAPHPQPPFLLRQDIKPLCMHSRDKLMNYMPPVSKVGPENFDAYGWYFQDHPSLPDFNTFTVETLGSGAQHWSGSDMTEFKLAMTALAGRRNPYYFGNLPSVTDLSIVGATTTSSHPSLPFEHDFGIAFELTNNNSFKPIKISVYWSVEYPVGVTVSGPKPNYNNPVEPGAPWSRLAVGTEAINVTLPPGASFAHTESISFAKASGLHRYAVYASMEGKQEQIIGFKVFDVLPDVAPPDNEVDIGF